MEVMSLYVIQTDDISFHEGRERIIEKLPNLRAFCNVSAVITLNEDHRNFTEGFPAVKRFLIVGLQGLGSIYTPNFISKRLTINQ